MLFSLALILIFGILITYIFEKIKFPRIVGFLILGMILGKAGFALLDDKIYLISAEIRKIALIIILLRVGLSLDLYDLKRVGRPALLLSFVPALFEVLGYIVLAPIFLGFNLRESLILASIIAAVSPAIIVPRMLYFMENKYGTKKALPQMLLAGASFDDIFVLALFGIAINLYANSYFSLWSIANIFLSIIFGILIGLLFGYIYVHGILKFKKISLIHQVLIVLSMAFILVVLEDIFKAYISISGMLAVISFASYIRVKIDVHSVEKLSKNFANLWIVAEIFLFVLVGAIVDFTYISKNILALLILLFLSLVCRAIGVFVSLINTNFSFREKIFCVCSYIPKATVQAAIGSIPLGMGFVNGDIMLAMAVLSILVTAPIGAFLIDGIYKGVLEKEERESKLC